ncbi:MAG: twin-arginine translocase subunit TatC [Ilumatobacteraceae bacterium]
MKLPGGATTSDRPHPDDHMTLIEHLAELRMRLIRSVLAIVGGFIIVMALYRPILNFLSEPYNRICAQDASLNCENNGLFILSPMEGFSTRMSVSLYGGVVLALPVILWQIWRFVVPGLHKKEKQYALPFVFSSIVLFLLGGFIAYWTLDKALQFLISFSGADIRQAFQISQYVRFVGIMIAAFGVGMEFPVLLVFLQLVGVLKYQMLFRAWRYAIVGIVALAAIITPSGDPISLAALSVPMIALYFVAALIGMFVQRRRAKAETT